MNSEMSNVLNLSPVTVVKAEKQTEPRLSSAGKEEEAVRAATVTTFSNDLQVSSNKAIEDKSKEGSKKDESKSSLDLVKKAVDEGNQLLQVVKRNLQFKVDEDTKELVVKIIDSESGETVRQIPSDEMLELIKRMKELEGQQGLMIQDRA